MKKRLMALISAVVMVLVLCPITVLHVQAAEVDSFLGIPYYGDISKCKLTPKQAQVYIDSIEEWLKYSSNKSNIFLCDADGSGIPVPTLMYDYGGTIVFWADGTNTEISWAQTENCLWRKADGTYSWESYFVMQGHHQHTFFTAASGLEGSSDYTSYNGQMVDNYVYKNGEKYLLEGYSTEQSLSDGLDYWSEDYDSIHEQAQTMMNSFIKEMGYTKKIYSSWENDFDDIGIPAETALSALKAYADGVDSLYGIHYYGDVEKCNLTGKQAAAFAEKLAELLSGSNKETVRYVYLCDPDGSGHPVMGISTKYEDMSGYSAGTHFVFGVDSKGTVVELAAMEFDNFASSTYLFEDVNGGYFWFEYTGAGSDIANAITAKHGTLTEETSIFWTLDGSFQKNGQIICENDFDKAYDLFWEAYDEMLEGAKRRVTTDGIAGNAALSALRAYAEDHAIPTYSTFRDILGTGWENEALAVAQSQVDGEAVACYSLTDGICYFILQETNGTFQGVLMGADRVQGQVKWAVRQVDPEVASEESLLEYVNDYRTTPNVTVDFGTLQKSLSGAELAEYLNSLLTDMTGKTPNELARSELATFVENAISSIAVNTVEGKNGKLVLNGTMVEPVVNQGTETLGTLTAVLEDNGVTLDKELSVVTRLLWEDGNVGERAGYLTLDSDLANSLKSCDLQLLLGDNQHYVQFSSENLRQILKQFGAVTVQFSLRDGGYDFLFADKDGQEIAKLPVPVAIGLPAQSGLDTVFASHDGQNDNWGGQYDAVNGVITFETVYSGHYEVLDNNVEITDIGELSEDSKTAISFLISKGYMAVENGKFRPNDSLSRYEFAEALVGMFFALDRSLTTTFPDVSKDNPYYSYVASAQAKELVSGFPDGTFGGETNITTEQMLALAARTLINQGYVLPEDGSEYLTTFNDKDSIASWAKELVALSVREGLQDRVAILNPQADITREQAAAILYRLFLLLYDVPPVALDLPQVESSDDGMTGATIALGVGGVALIAGVALALIILRKRNNTTPFNETTAAKEEPVTDQGVSCSCGTQNPSNAKFCQGCGKPLKQEETEC